jgi:hypothetical protein
LTEAGSGALGWVFINLALGLATDGLYLGFSVSGGKVEVQNMFSGCFCLFFPLANFHSPVSIVGFYTRIGE